MAGWGVMMGLGQSLQQVGGMINDYNKDKVRSKLELEREERADKRQKDKEARDQAQFSGQYRNDFTNGMRYRLNKAGDPMGEGEPIPQHELTQFNRAERTSGLQETLLGNQVTTTSAAAGVAGELAGLSVEDKRADIDARRAQAEASRANAAYTRSGRAKGLEDAITGPERSEVVTDIMKDLGSFGEEVPRAELLILVEDSLTHAENMKRRNIEVDPLAYARTLIANRYGEGYGDRGKRDTLTPLDSDERKKRAGSPSQLDWR